MMKTKRLLGSLFMGVFGGIIAIFVFSLIFFKHLEPQRGNSIAEAQKAQSVSFVNSPTDTSPVESAFNMAAELAVKSVVHVKTESEVEYYQTDPFYYFFYGDRGQRQVQPVTGIGSGVILSSDGYIVTNNHVIEGAKKIEVTLDDKRKFKAELVGADPTTDLALLKIDADNLPYLHFGNIDDVRLGDWVLAVGNPFNLTSTVTAGIISAKGRNLGILGDQKYRIESYLQTDAALNPGNSGGALVNLKGELIGVNAAIVSPTRNYSGNSFSIPVDIVAKVVKDLEQYGQVQRAIMGVTIRDVTADLVKEKNLDKIEGVYVDSVTEDGAADAAGIKDGDVILSLNDKKVNSVSALQEEISKYRPKDKVTVTIKRGNKTQQINVVLRNLEGSTEMVKASDYIQGAKFEKVTEKQKKKFGIDNGVQIKDIRPGKLMDLGLQKDYILLSINGQRLNTAEDVFQILGSGNDIKAIEGIQPNGMYFNYEFRQ